MKFIKDTARVNFQHLQKDVVVLRGSCNDVARNNSFEGSMKHISDFGINSNHTNGILMSIPHTHDLIQNS